MTDKKSLIRHGQALLKMKKLFSIMNKKAYLK